MVHKTKSKTGEIKGELFTVYGTEQTNWGEDKIDVKHFRDLKSAYNYAKKLLPELKAEAKTTDEPDGIYIENKKGENLGYWRIVSGGKFGEVEDAMNDVRKTIRGK